MKNPSNLTEKKPAPKDRVNERQERVKHLYNTMRRSMDMKQEEKKLASASNIMSSWYWVAGAVLVAFLLLLWKFFF